MLRVHTNPSLDPLLAWAPPPDVTQQDREARLKREAQARRVSDEIDASLREEKVALKKRSDVIKVMLLGQSESGVCLSSPLLSKCSS